MSEKELITLIKDGKDAYFENLMGRFSNFVKKVIGRMVHNTDIIEELTQDVFLKIYASIQRFNTEYKFSSWIGIIARNTAIDYLRKNQKQDYVHFEDHPGFEFNIQDEEDTIYAFIEKSQLSTFLKKRIAELPPKYREILKMRFYQEKAYDEIASQLRIPMGTVKNRLFRAKYLLKEKLEKPHNIHYLEQLTA